jgi:hypothetical protein
MRTPAADLPSRGAQDLAGSEAGEFDVEAVDDGYPEGEQYPSGEPARRYDEQSGNSDDRVPDFGRD